jgi:hypothetical protein
MPMRRLATPACGFACAVLLVACASPKDDVAPAQAGFAACLLLIESQYIEEVNKDVLYQSTLRALSEDFELDLREQGDEALSAECGDESTLIPARIGSRADLISAEAALSAVLDAGCSPRVSLWRKIPALRAFAYRFVGSLDSGSKYLAREEFADFIGRGPFGVGIAVAEADSGAIIIEVYADAPASRAGLRTGDRIFAVDGIGVANLSPNEVADLLRGD